MGCGLRGSWWVVRVWVMTNFEAWCDSDGSGGFRRVLRAYLCQLGGFGRLFKR